MTQCLDYNLYPCRGKQVRLLKLQPDDASGATDVLCYTMQVVSLDDHPAYEAVSYVWGQENDVRTIRIGGSTLEIPGNAGRALRYMSRALFSAGSTSSIWLDAVCVDQSDDIDRSHQVASMADVYRYAEKVLIFLGPPFGGSADIVLSIAEAVKDLDLEASLAKGDSSKVQQCLDNLDMESLEHFFSSPWFKRLWVVQESVLSKQAIFFYGSAGVDMTSALILAAYLRENQYTTYESRGQKVAQITQMEYATEIYDTRLRRSRLQLAHGLSEHEVGSSLGNLLSSFHDRQSLDPCDKIFAILGLCWPCTAASITPDYSESLRDIYLHASSLAFTESGSDDSINILRYARNMGHKPTSWYKEHNWPTWLPCWQYPFDLIRNPSLISSQKCPADRVVAPTEGRPLSVDRNCLSFSGIIFDTVIQTTAPMIRHKEKVEAKPDNHQGLETEVEKEQVVVRVEDVDVAVANCLDLVAGGGWLPDHRSMISIIGETLVAGDYGYNDEFSLGEAHFDSVLQYTSHKSMSRELSSEAHTMVLNRTGDAWTNLRGFDVHTTFRLCFSTSEGYLGLGSEHILTGDIVCVPQGSQTPYILRKEDDHYILVGQCYMSNEYLARSTIYREERRFDIR